MTKKQVMKELDAVLSNLPVTAEDNSAVARCCRTFTLMYCQTRLKGKSAAEATERARRAYRLSMPAIDGEENVRDFIACATFGFLSKLFEPDEVTKLLYAAQVASQALHSRYKSKAAIEPLSSPAPEPHACHQTGQPASLSVSTP